MASKTILPAEPYKPQKEDNPLAQSSIRPMTIRLPSGIQRKFKDLATVKNMSQAQLIEELLKEHSAMEAAQAQTSDNTKTGPSGTIDFKPVLISRIGESINKKGKLIRVKGEMIYTEQNRMFKEATIFLDNLMEDYGIDVSSGDFLIFNTACIAKITHSEDPEANKHKFITWESVLLVSKKRMNEGILRNDWVSYSDSADEVLNQLSDYVDVGQRSAIGFVIPDCDGDEGIDFFVPKTARTKNHD